MFELAQVLAQRTPAITILVNGGEYSKNEVLKSVRLGWSLIIIENTGRLADEIAALWKEKVETKKDPCIEDPVMAEIIADGNIQLFPLDCPPEKLDTLIHDHFTRSINPTLELAWERFDLPHSQ
jgi:hypothetical protein